MTNKFKLIICIIFLLTLLLDSSTPAQVCSENKDSITTEYGILPSVVTCPNSKTPFCSEPAPYPICSFLGPRCCPSFSTYRQCGQKLESLGQGGSSQCFEQLCSKTPQCLSLCDSGYTVCSSTNLTSCCLYGCCPLDPTQCKCKNSDRCEPFCGTPTYSCNSGLTICPNNTTPGALCCQYGCCPSDPTKCKCALNNQCFPSCSPPGITDCNSTYPSCNGTCPSGQACTVTISGFTPGCSCLPTVSTSPTPIPITLSCPLPCSNSSVCGSGKYCNLTTMCCALNPSGCFTGCYLSSSECETSEQCVSNCCIPLPPELVITGSESINLATRPKLYSIAITVTGLNFQSKNRCEISTRNSSLRMRFNPSRFFLEAGKSSITTNGMIQKASALKRINLIPIDVNCDNGTSANKTIKVAH